MPQLRGQQDEIRRVLESMRKDGMLVSAESLLREFDGDVASARAEKAGPAVVVIPTAERPEALSRLLGSIRAHGEPGAIDTLCVVDDSRSEENAARNRQIVEDFAADSPVDTRYVGRAPEQVLEFLAAEVDPVLERHHDLVGAEGEVRV